MTSTREQQLLARTASMEKIISGLTSTITKMNEQRNSLQDEVIMLKKRVSILESINISSKTSTTLQRQLETQQQYSRRNCKVIDNIKVDKQEDEASLTAKVTKIVETLEQDATPNLSSQDWTCQGWFTIHNSFYQALDNKKNLQQT